MVSPFEPGELLAGKYRVESVLGRGGMGVVVSAVHEQLEKRVALKFLLSGVADSDAVSRFLREAKAAVRLHSEHVAKVLDVGTLETGSPYMVMEYLEGQDLAELLEANGALPYATAVDYVLQACEAIAEAHRLGIVHRDLKPANLFVTRRVDGTPCVKVLDFGISKLLGEQPGSMTQTRALLGTPYYMAPEQMRSSKNVSPRSDVWSLGMVLYELLTGQVAYRQETLPELCMAILVDPIPPIRDACPDIPPGLEAAVDGALEKDPDARFQTVGDFAAALGAFGGEGGQRAADRVSRVLDRVPEPRPTLASGAGSRGTTLRQSDIETVARPVAPPIEALDTERPPAPEAEAATPSEPADAPADPSDGRLEPDSTSEPDEEPSVAPAPASRPARTPWLVGAVVLGAAAIAGGLLARSTDTPRPVEVRTDRPVASAVASATLPAHEATSAPSPPALPSPEPAVTPAMAVVSAPVRPKATTPKAAAPRPAPLDDFGGRK